MKILEHGWLVAQPEMAPFVGGVFIPPETRTRKEEYSFVVERLAQEKGQYVCDLATGFIPDWHRLAVILARAGWLVVASDMNPGVMTLPQHPRVTYMIADARHTGLPDHIFDIVTCISTLEHCTRTESREIVAEMQRLVKPGGLMIATADMAPWLPVLFGGSCDVVPTFEGHLDPPVYFITVEA